MNPKLQIMLSQAIQAFQGGNFERADSILKIVLQADAKNLPALNVLGLIKASQAKYKEASDLLGKAARIQPNDPAIQYNLAKSLYDSGSLKEAIPHHKKAVELAPNNPEAWLNYGKTLLDLSQYEQAIHSFNNALSLRPDFTKAYLNKGCALYLLHQYDEAIIHFDKVLSLKPDYAEAWLSKGLTLHEIKHFDEAIAHYDKALSLKLDYAEAWFNKGNALYFQHRYDETIALYDKALSLKPDYVEALLNKGNALYCLHQNSEAITHYDKVLSLRPENAEAWCYKGNALNQLKWFDEAIAYYDKALSLNSNYAEAWFNKGVTLNELKRFNEAIFHYDTAVSLKKDIDWVIGDLQHMKMKICDWSGFAQAVDNLTKKVVANEKVSRPFPLLALSDDAFLNKKCSEIYVQKNYPLNSALGPNPRHIKKQKIRIAYFSPDFRSHPVSFLTSELFEIHDRDRFEVFAFSLQKAAIEDETNLRLRKGFDRFIDVDNISDLAIAQLSRELKIDIAIDLAGPTQYSRFGIFSYRVAPIQVNWLGYPGTFGSDYIDYIVADKTLIPETHQQFYTEKVVYLPDTYMVDDSKRIASSRVFTRQECKLPENVFIFCCFNNDYKFNPQVLDSWSRILLGTERSILWVSENNESFKANIKIEFEKRGIHPSRIFFAQRVELMTDHLARYSLADLFLDTHPYNAHTTALDSLKAGVPVLTLKGQSFASRVAASLLNAIGLPELITTTQEEYDALAIELGTNHEKLDSIKKKLAKNRHIRPLFDTPIFTRHLEDAYRQMYERYQAGFDPDHLAIV